jgi:hypothetical protein
MMYERGKVHTSPMVNPTNLALPSGTTIPSALTTCANLTSSICFPSSSSHPQSRNSMIRQPRPCSQAVVLMAGTRTAPAPGRIFVTHWEVTTMAMLRVAASFWKALMRYWRTGNFRAEGFGAVKLLAGTGHRTSVTYH